MASAKWLCLALAGGLASARLLRLGFDFGLALTVGKAPSVGLALAIGYG